MPPGVITVTSTMPAEPAGEVAVIEVAETIVMPVAAVPPKDTPVAPVKPVPVSVMDVPPASGPDVGVIAETVGTSA